MVSGRFVKVALRVLVAAVFLFSFAYKLSEPATLPAFLAKLPWMPALSQSTRHVLSYVVMGVEGFVGVSALLGQRLRLSLTLAVLLPLLFAVLVGPFFDQMGSGCSCYWDWMPLSASSGLQLILRNAALAFLGILAFKANVVSVGTSAGGKGRELESVPGLARRRVVNWLPWGGASVVLAIALGLLWQQQQGGRSTVSPIPGIEITMPMGDAELGWSELVASGSRVGAGTSSTREEILRHAEEQQSRGTWQVIVDSVGTPLAGVRVYSLEDAIVFRRSDEAAGLRDLPLPMCTTGDDGVVRAATKATGVRLVASCDGYRPRTFVIDDTAPHSRPLTLYPSSGVTIQVANVEGVGIPGARLLVDARDFGWAGPSEGEYADLGKTDSSGRLIASPLQARCRGMIAADGYSLQAVDFGNALEGSGNLSFILPTATAVSGRLEGAGSRLAVHIFAERLSGSDQPQLVDLVTETGTFLHEALTNNTDWGLTPCVVENGRPAAIGPTITLRPPVGEIVLSTSPGVSVSLKALDPSGEPIEASVGLSLRSNSYLARAGAETFRMAPDGTLHWHSLPCPNGLLGGVADQELWILAEGFASSSAGRHVVQPGGMIDLGIVTLVPCDPWRIEVVDQASGTPVDGATVSFTPYSVIDEGRENSPWLQKGTTDSLGRVELKVPLTVSGILDVDAEGWSLYAEPVVQGTAEDLTVRLQRVAAVLLQCVSQEGEPVPHARVQWRSLSARNQSGRRWQAVDVGSDGSGSFQCPPGDVQVRHAPGMVLGSKLGMDIRLDLDAGGEPGAPDTEPIEVRGLIPGEIRTLDIKLPVSTSMDVIVITDGEPATGIRVVGLPGTELDVVLNDIWGTLDMPRAVTDSSGRCTLVGLPLGLISIATIDPKTRVATFKVVQVDHVLDVPIYVETWTRDIEALVLGTDGRPRAGIPVQLEQLSIQHGAKLPALVSVSPAGVKSIQGPPVRRIAGVTDSRGRASFHRVPREARFRLSCSDSARFPLMGTARVDVGNAEGIVRIVDGSGAAILLELVTEDQSPIENESAVLRWRNEFGRKQKVLHYSDGNGVIRFSALAPGSYTLGFSSGKIIQLVLDAGELHSEVIDPRR